MTILDNMNEFIVRFDGPSESKHDDGLLILAA